MPCDAAPAAFRTARSWSLDAATRSAAWATETCAPSRALATYRPFGDFPTPSPQRAAGRGREGALGGQGHRQLSPCPQGQDPGRSLPVRPRPWDPRQDMATPWARGTHFLPLPEATPKGDSERGAAFQRRPGGAPGASGAPSAGCQVKEPQVRGKPETVEAWASFFRSKQVTGQGDRAS